MTPKKVKQAFDACTKMILDDAGDFYKLVPQRCPADRTAQDEEEILEHALWMCEEGKKLVDENRIEKAMRWLGFVQGAIWAAMSATIEDMKKVNMPTTREGDDG